MPKTNKNDQLAQDDLCESDPRTSQESEMPQYAVGYCRPPIETRFQKGKSGYPAGRPKGRRNVKSELKEIARRNVKIRDGDKEREMSLLAANFFAHAIKGAKGDVRSTALVLNLADRVGLMNSEDGADNRLWCEDAGGVALGRNSTAPSSGHLGGDITALSTGDFEEVKRIVNKGRGKDVTPV